MPQGRFILLKKKKVGERDIIIDALCKTGQRLKFKAIGALNSKKRFAGGILDPIHYVEIYYSQTARGFPLIREARLIWGFTKLKKSYKSLEMAFYFMDLVYQGSREGLVENESLFNLLGNSLKELEMTKNLNFLKLQFEIRYIFYSGFLNPSSSQVETLLFRKLGDYEGLNWGAQTYEDLSQMTSRYLKKIISSNLGV